MPERALNETIDTLALVAGTDADWKPLRDARDALQDRVAWLRRQAATIPAPLVAVLVGGTGTGKSTLLNALAGAAIATTGATRPTTDEPTVYHPVGDPPDVGIGEYIASRHLQDIVLIDLPDTDSIRLEHRERVREMLGHADVILFCATQQKYKNEQTIALLRPFKHERAIVCIQTRADQDADVCSDWAAWMKEEGFQVEKCYRISALNAFRRSQEAENPGDVYQFDALEKWLREKLPPERTRIKTQNIRGAARTTTQRLMQELQGKDLELQALDERLREIEARITQATLAELQARLLDEPHVWVVALGDAVGERAFGLIGLLYRVVHGLRMLPSRLMGRASLSRLLRKAPPEPNAPRDEETGAEKPFAPDDAFLMELSARFRPENGEASAYLARAGFRPQSFPAWQKEFVEELSSRLAQLLAPVQRRLTRRARRLSRWLLPALEIVWLAPLAFTLGVPLYHYYENLVFHAEVVLPEPYFISRSFEMIGVTILFELMAFAFVIRIAGRGLRRRLRRELSRGMMGEGQAFGFTAQHREIQKAADTLQLLHRLETQP